MLPLQIRFRIKLPGCWMLVEQAVLTIIHEVNLFQTSFIRTNQVYVEFYESLMFAFYTQKVHNNSHVGIVWFCVPEHNQCKIEHLEPSGPLSVHGSLAMFQQWSEKNCDILK